MNSRCAMCTNTHRQILATGPPGARVMLIGEGPGFFENKLGVPFVGRSGDELNRTYLPLAGLVRSDIYVTNAVQCRQERNGVDVKPTEALTRCCADNHLQEEIYTINPDTIILLGSTACSLVGGIDLEFDHGFPRAVYDCEGLYGFTGMVVPWYHPAAGMHESRFMIPLLEDAARLELYNRGKWSPPDVSQIRPNYQLVTRSQQIKDAFEVLAYEYVPIDTESDENRPWSLQFSTRPGNGFMILAKDKHLIEDFDTWFQFEGKGKMVAHHVLHDLDELENMGVTVNAYRDTMQELYHLGNLPQGLKAATYRTSGHRMISYDEVVTPWSKSALMDWLSEALAFAGALRESTHHPVGKGCPTCGKSHRKDMSKEIPHESEAVLRRLMKHTAEEGGDYDPWLAPKWKRGEETVRLFGRPWLPEFEAAIRRVPRRSIVHAPLAEAVAYGCSDADHTGRLATWLTRERERIVREEWSV